MANKKRRCRQCKKYFDADSGIDLNGGFYCSMGHALDYANDNKSKQLSRVKSQKHKERKKEVMKRSDWYAKLQALVNQLVRIRDIGQPCPTCGVNGESVSWDAGHFIPQKGSDPRRFYMKNNHRQCVHCNQYNSGKRAEYRIWMIEKYGLEFVEWLECDKNHKPLREQFPHWSDIEKAIIKARVEIRSLGFTPCR